MAAAQGSDRVRDATLNLDVEEDELLGVDCDNTTGVIVDPVMEIEVAWRLP